MFTNIRNVFLGMISETQKLQQEREAIEREKQALLAQERDFMTFASLPAPVPVKSDDDLALKLSSRRERPRSRSRSRSPTEAAFPKAKRPKKATVERILVRILLSVY